MERFITDSPDNWIVLQLPDNQFKVFGVWFGGYLSGDQWKLNSGIAKIEEDENHYYFTGYSGSCYQCGKDNYGLIGVYGPTVLGQLLENHTDIVVLEELEDFINVAL